MYLRAKILKIIIYAIPKTRYTAWLIRRLIQHAYNVNHQTMIFLASTDNLSLMNKAILYVRENEIADNVKIIHIYEEESEMLNNFIQNVKFMDKVYPKMKIDFVGVKGVFSPETIDEISKIYNVPKNLIFISCPSSKFPTKVDALGGVRIITTSERSDEWVTPQPSLPTLAVLADSPDQKGYQSIP